MNTLCRVARLNFCISSGISSALRTRSASAFGVRALSHRRFFSDAPQEQKEQIVLKFIKGNEEKTVSAPVGSTVLEIAHKNDIDLEGACEGSLACSTCHVILDQDYYDKLPEPTDEENDMLDLAFGLTNTSRLGCQIILNKELDGMVLRLPAATRNMAVDGFKPAKH